MGYFPFFIDLSGRRGLIVGGGSVALRKIEKLLPYNPQLTVAAEEICPEIKAIDGLILLEQPFLPRMLEGKFFVIAATDNRDKNSEIAALCHERRILVNAVDDQKMCSFIFPALVKDGNLSVGISTSGASPTAAAYIKNRISSILPEDFGEILSSLNSARGRVKAEIGDERSRAVCFARLFELCMEKERPLNEDELRKTIKESRKSILQT